MKKILSILLALCTVLTLFCPVLAEGEVLITSIRVSGIDLPAAGEHIPEKPLKEAKVKVLSKAENEDEEPKELDNFTASAFWAEAAEPEKALKETAFVTGRTYRLTVTLEFDVLDNAPTVEEDETQVLINDQKAAKITSAGEKIIFSADYVATPGDFTPKVSLTTTGSKNKSYDGEGTVVKAAVEKLEGIEYRYEWYRDDKVMEQETTESITLTTVADSGKYSCKVYATAPSDKETGEKSTKTSAVEISITPYVVTVDIQDAEKNVFNPDPEFTYVLLGDPYDELTGELARKEGEDIGKYTIGIGTLAFPEAVAANYTVHVNEGTLTILAVGELSYNKIPDASVADQSYITGKDNAKITLRAPEGALEEGTLVSLTLAEDEVKAALEKEFSAKILKSFTVKLRGADGKDISLPKPATLRIEIPLTEEEEKNFLPETLFCALYTKSGKKLTPQIEKKGEVTYLLVEIDTVGTVAVFEGEKSAPVGGTATDKTKPAKKVEEEKGGSAWLWILIVLLSLAAIGAIVFTVIQNKNTSARTKKYVHAKKPPLTPQQLQERERARRIADEINAMPPVPEKRAYPESGSNTRAVPTPHRAEDNGMRTRAVPQQTTRENGMQTRAVPAPRRAEENAMRTRAVPAPQSVQEQAMRTRPAPTVPKNEANPREGQPRKISFEDLE